MGDFWRVEDKPASKQVTLHRISDSTKADKHLLLWLENDPPGVSSDDGSRVTIAYSDGTTPIVPKPVIVTQPANVSVVEGNPLTLTIVAKNSITNNTTGLSYQWQKNDSGWKPVSGATSASLVLPNTTPVGTASYRCVVSIGAESVTSNAATATVTAVAIPALEWDTAPPATATALTNVTATWKGGKAPYHAVIAQKGGGAEINNQNGNDKSVVANVDGTNAPIATYTWTITDSSNLVKTLTGETIFQAPTLAFSLDLPTTALEDHYLGNNEKIARQEVTATGGIPPYHYQWKRSSSQNISGNDDPVLDVEVDAAFPSSGNYGISVIVTDSANPASEKQSVTSKTRAIAVYELPRFTVQPPATLTVATGAQLAISATPATTSKPARQYLWQKLGADGTTWATAVGTGGTSNSFSIAAVTAADAGSYRVRMRDANGKQVFSNVCVVTINP